ncbi:transposase [Amycolatopsis sacchari]|uniref:transposase n=1 Tax=Amycolatopsis sacchari TaxID=115433 RepID=UPI003EBDDEEF
MGAEGRRFKSCHPDKQGLTCGFTPSLGRRIRSGSAGSTCERRPLSRLPTSGTRSLVGRASSAGDKALRRQLARPIAPAPAPGGHDRTGHGGHRVARVREFIAAHHGSPTVVRLPVYAPDLNAAEDVWANPKKRVEHPRRPGPERTGGRGQEPAQTDSVPTCAHRRIPCPEWTPAEVSALMNRPRPVNLWCVTTSTS